MKTIKITTILALSLIMTIGLFANSTTFIMEKEAYIEDIPFNTANISADCLYKMAVAVDFEMEEEAYIDDIPFNTECVTINCKYLKAMNTNFELPEQEYINDIPFSTKMVRHNLICKK